MIAQTLLEVLEVTTNHPWNGEHDAIIVGQLDYESPSEWLEDQDTLNLYAEERQNARN